MKNKIAYIALSVATCLTFNSCKNDLEVLAPGKESVSVYGVINPNDPIQKIRINKVYLTDGDAVVAGQSNENINYGPGELRVSLQRFLDGVQAPAIKSTAVTEIVLTETVVTTTDGNFNSSQRIWQTSAKLFNTGQYKLLIKNMNTGAEFSSESTMVDSVKSYPAMPFIYAPFAPPSHYPVHCGSGNAGYTPPTSGIQTQSNAYVDYSVLTGNPRLIKFRSVPNAKLYKVIMRFHYIDSLTDGTTGYRRFVDYNFPTQTSSTLVGGEEMEVSFSVPDFYTTLANQIPKQTVGTIKNRTCHFMEYIIYASNEDMNTFLKVNEPSNSIAQDKPNYTNINGGVGIFAALSKTSLKKELKDDFINQIADNPTTISLQFVKRYAFICP